MALRVYDQVHDGALTRSYGNVGDVLPLDELENLLIRPLYEGTFNILLKSFLITSLSLYMMKLSFRVRGQTPVADALFEDLCIQLYQIVLPICALIVFSLWCAPLFQVPCGSIVAAFFNKVRDDNYLVGRKLQNLTKQSAHKPDIKTD